MIESIKNFWKKFGKKEEENNSKTAAKERLHLVLMQDRANVSADFLEMMKQEIVEVIKKYIEVDEAEMDVRLTNQTNEDGTNGAPALYANIPIVGIKNEKKKILEEKKKEEVSKEEVSKEKVGKEEVSKEENITNEKNEDKKNKKENDEKINKPKDKIINKKQVKIKNNKAEKESTIDNNKISSTKNKKNTSSEKNKTSKK